MVVSTAVSTKVSSVNITTIVAIVIMMKISMYLQLLLEWHLNKDEYVFKMKAQKPFRANEIILWVMSTLLVVGICIFLHNQMWTTTQNDEVGTCDSHYAYLQDGYFVPVVPYDPADKEGLLAKYCPEKLPKN